jgi:hypothetical protein
MTIYRLKSSRYCPGSRAKFRSARSITGRMPPQSLSPSIYGSCPILGKWGASSLPFQLKNHLLAVVGSCFHRPGSGFRAMVCPLAMRLNICRSSIVKNTASEMQTDNRRKIMSSQVRTQISTSLLTKVLRADGLFALLSGMLLVFGVGPVSDLIDLAYPIALAVLGVVLLGYAGMLLIYAGR